MVLCPTALKAELVLPSNAQLKFIFILHIISMYSTLQFTVLSFTLQAAAAAIASSKAVESETDPPTEYEELNWGTDIISTSALPSPALLAQSSKQNTSATPTAVGARTQVNTRLHYFCFISHSVLILNIRACQFLLSQSCAC